MRLFTGIDLPAAQSEALETLIRQLSRLADLRWSRVENLHITTKFIGQWPQERLDELRERLSMIPAPPSISIAVRGVGWFPNPHQPKILWASVQAKDSLEQLVRATDESVAELGIEKDDRPFRPHLTMARIGGRRGGKKRIPDLRALQRAIGKLPTTDFGEFEARAFHLYLSEPGAHGSRYTKLFSFPLGTT